MISIHFLVAVVAALVAAVTGSPLSAAGIDTSATPAHSNKSILNPEVDVYDWAFIGHLNYSHDWHIDYWNLTDLKLQRGETGICRDCEAVFRDAGLKAEDMQIYNVTYADCDEPWVMCRHRLSSKADHMAAFQFSMIPVGMRQYIRHAIILPTKDEQSHHAFWKDDQVIIVGDVSSTSIAKAVARGVAVHGIRSHPGEAPIGPTNPFYNTTRWLKAYEKDSVVMNTESWWDPAENFNSVAVMAMFDDQPQSPAYGPAWNYVINEDAIEKIKHQLDIIQQEVIPKTFSFNPAAKCQNRWVAGLKQIGWVALRFVTYSDVTFVRDGVDKTDSVQWWLAVSVV
ncbi:hypothetical protein CC80DRAFT_498937 [Byssothecium circinans]|uniref:Uncharacterized protein n=1 Tax=Byssothecium circinans TaxID=147558 RepID=A0A6A5UHL7_9PLEO|nr:hypothetical protein CC80DRAFT_498937 [Byssothecium circinans]